MKSFPVRLLHRCVLPFLLIGLVAAPLAAAPIFKNLRSGEFESLPDLQRDGNWLVVMIWASDCEICKLEAPAYQAFHQRDKSVNARVVGLTLDGAEYETQAREFVARHGLEFDNLIAEPEAVMTYYQALTGSRWVGTPSFLVFAPDGKLMAKQVGAVEPEVVEGFIAANSPAQ